MWPELSYKAIKGSDERDCAQVLHQSKDGDNYEVWSRQTGQLDKVRSAVIKYLLHFIICCLLSAWPKKFRLSEAQRQTDLFVVFDQVPSEVYSKTEVLVESNVCVWFRRNPCEESCLSVTVRGAELVSPALTPGLINADQVLDLVKEGDGVYSFWGWCQLNLSITAISADLRLAREGEVSARLKLGQILWFVIVVPGSTGLGCICEVFIEGLLERIAFDSKTEWHFYGIRMKNVCLQTCFCPIFIRQQVEDSNDRILLKLIMLLKIEMMIIYIN